MDQEGRGVPGELDAQQPHHDGEAEADQDAGRHDAEQHQVEEPAVAAELAAHRLRRHDRQHDGGDRAGRASSEERISGGLKSFITVAFHSSSYQWNETPFIGKVVPPVGPAKDSRPRVKIGSH